MYYIYMLRCADNSLYTGITTDIKRRLSEHFEKSPKCAKYTFVHTAVKLEKLWSTETRKAASALEYRIKQLKKEQKEQLASASATISDLLSNTLDPTLFKTEELFIVQNS